MRQISFLLLVPALFCTTDALVGQSAQRLSAQASALYVAPSGDAYQGFDAGFGVEAQLRYTPSAFSLGLGYQRSSHDFDIGTGRMESATLAGVFVEPRYVIDVGSMSYAPYLAARVALLTEKAEIAGLSAEASGTQINLGGGVLVRLTPRMNLDLGLTYGAIDFDEITLAYQGDEVVLDETGGSGRNLVLRVGVTVGVR